VQTQPPGLESYRPRPYERGYELPGPLVREARYQFRMRRAEDYPPYQDVCEGAPLWGAVNSALEGDAGSEPAAMRGSACTRLWAR